MLHPLLLVAPIVAWVPTEIHAHVHRKYFSAVIILVRANRIALHMDDHLQISSRIIGALKWISLSL